ncbi:ComEC/Rec2 family competence protein [Mucilaginibacter sp.]|uniref:ComEC/Rec2 family competence protein n=1 Tax=Mucilaginibacter sp. TaxID=1882438 RepID=UPI0035BC270C
MIASHKGEIPVVILLLPFMAGIAGGICFFNSTPLWSIWIAAGLLTIFTTLGIGYNKFEIYKHRWLGGLLLYPLLFSFGWLLAVYHNELKNPGHFANKPAQYIAVTITTEPKVNGDLVRFNALITYTINNGKADHATGAILLTIKDELAKKLFYGEQLLIPAKFNQVDPPFNPGEFNYKQYLADHNIHYQAFLFPKQYVILKAGHGNPVVAYALQLRQNMVKKLQTNMRDTNAIAVASTLILGYKADLSNDILQAYSKTGTVHILSVSGGHVAIIFLLLNWMLSFLNTYHRGRVIKAVVIISLIWAYSLLSGFSPAVCRATVMISLIITGKTYSRYINSLNILAASAFALLLYDPFFLADVGFQLSYLAVAGLIALQPVIYNRLHFKNSIADKLWMACSVSIAAQVITFPLSAYYFHQFPVYFLVSNLLIAIPVAAILYCGILLLLLPQVFPMSQWLGYALERLILLMNKGLTYIESAPYASINKIWLTRWEYIILVAATILFFYFIYFKKAWLIKTALACSLLFCISITVKRISADSIRSVTFLNLRKHTGIVFKNGSRGIVLTDLQDTDKYFKYAIQPGLDSARITDYKIYDLNSSVDQSWVMKRRGFVQFLNKKLILLNSDVATPSIMQPLDYDYLYVNTNSFPNRSLITNTGLMIIGAGNTEKRVNELQRLAIKEHKKFWSLRRNKCFTATSN